MTVGALLAVELILYIAAAGVLTLMIDTGYLQTQFINLVITEYTSDLQHYLSEAHPNQEEMDIWLDRIRPAPYALGINVQETDGLLIVGSDGILLAVSPPDYVDNGMIGRLLDPQSIEGMESPLQSALAGEMDTQFLYSAPNSDNDVVMVVPIMDAANEQVLGALVMSVAVPSITSLFGDLFPILGISMLFFALVAGLIGTVFGYLAARGLVHRLDRLAEATLGWSQGDFDVFVDDPSGDELGLLVRRLNHMAQQLQQLLETRSQFVVVEERNRLARDLHDSAKQQAFAAAAQISAARKLLHNDPAAAETHIEEAERLIFDLRKELTNLIQELRPAALEDKGLASAVREYTLDWSRQNGIEVDVRVQQERSLPLDIEQAIFRIVQEALANAARHSQAKHVEVGLAYGKQEITFTISDDGLGFDPDKVHSGFGLQSMRERVNALGSALTIETALGEGTSLSFTVPLHRPTESEESEIHE